MTPDEVVKVLENENKKLREVSDMLAEDCTGSELYKAIKSTISLIQDYQKLRERVSVEKILDITKTCKTSLSGLRTLEDIAQAIVTYLQQPTEH